MTYHLGFLIFGFSSSSRGVRGPITAASVLVGFCLVCICRSSTGSVGPHGTSWVFRRIWGKSCDRSWWSRHRFLWLGLYISGRTLFKSELSLLLPVLSSSFSCLRVTFSVGHAAPIKIYPSPPTIRFVLISPAFGWLTGRSLRDY